MANNFVKFRKGINIENSGTAVSEAGDVGYDGDLKFYDGAIRTIVALDKTQTLTGKTITKSDNTISHIDGSNTGYNYSLATSVGASALTIALKDASGSDCSATSKAFFGFRSATLTTGTYAIRTVSAALSLVISSGSTMGLANGVEAYIYIYLLDNAGTLELAASSTRYDDGTIISTTAEGGAGAADSFYTIYSTTTRASVAIRCIGRLRMTEATAGTWASNATEITLLPFFTGRQIVVGTAQTADGTRSNAAFGAPTNQPTVTWTAGKTGRVKVMAIFSASGTAGNTNTFRLNATAGSPVVVFSQENSWDAVAGFAGTEPVSLFAVYWVTAGTSYTVGVEVKSSGAGALLIKSGSVTNGTALIVEQMD